MKNNAKYKILKLAYADYDESIVKIDYDKIQELDLKGFSFEKLADNEQSALHGKTLKESVYFLLALNSINYQYWDLNNGEFYRYSNNQKVGAIAAFEGFENMWADREKENIYSKMMSPNAKDVIDHYFGSIPEKNSRIEIFRESMNPDLLNKAFDIINKDIQKGMIDTDTAAKVAEIMPISFKEPYLKKIQLALYEVAVHARGLGIDVKEDITVAADYQLPKVMEAKGVLIYSPELQKKIDNQVPIQANSAEEKALRSATIIGCDVISSEHKISIPALDRWLWIARNDYKDKKFHLTKTTAY